MARPRALEVEQLPRSHQLILTRGSDIPATIGAMSDPAPSKPVGITPVVAIISAIAALCLIPVAAGMHPLALVLGVAALLVGIVAAVNVRRAGGGNAWLPYLAIALGLLTIIVVVVLNFL